jgi:hypothetical protein
MRQLLLVSSLLSAVTALAMVAICVVMPKLEWILATVVLAALRRHSISISERPVRPIRKIQL